MTDSEQRGMDRRKFLKVAGAQTGLLMGATGCAAETILGSAAVPSAAPEIVVIGAGAFGGWTALYLRELGHSVTLVDAYGPGNSRSTSGDETRGIRTGYATNELWTTWASEAIRRWKQRDQEWGTQLFTPTGDLIMREAWDTFQTDTRATWDKLGVKYEVLSHDELAYRYPQINSEGIEATLYEQDAGIGRSRAACLTVADQFRKKGGDILLSRAAMGERAGGKLLNVRLNPGEALSAQTFVFALGPWFPKEFPDVIGDSIRIPLGHVFYFGTPVGDNRFTTPNIPSYNFPGVTGWASVAHDARGFRVRTGGRPPEDPDYSVRWIAEEYHERARQVLVDRFPALKDAPLVETRSCHYEIPNTRNFIVDQHPELSNVWIAGGGSAEGFKFGPVIGQYIAERVTGRNTDPELINAFRLPTTTTVESE